MTPLLAASASTTLPLRPLLMIVLVWALAHSVACWRWPWTTCSGCSGSGRRRSPSGLAWRDCPRCHGRGRRQRLGRRIWGN